MQIIKTSRNATSKVPVNFFLFILCLGLFVNPFIFWPNSPIAFEIPKVWFVNHFIEILGIMGLVFSPLLIRKEKLNSYVILTAMAFFTAVIISSFLGSNFAKSFWGNYYRADGIFTLTHLFILFFLTALILRKKFINPLMVTISLSSILLSMWAMANAVAVYFFKLPSFFVWKEGIGVNFGNPNFFAGYLIVTLPFTKYIYDKAKTKIIATGVITIHIIAILLTQAWIGIFGIILFFLLTLLSYKNRNNILLIFFISMFLITGISFIRYSRKVQKPGIVVAESRERIFKKGLIAFSQKPIFGWGWANFDYAFDSAVWPVKFETDAYVDKAHSHLLETLVTTGITGFILYAFLLIRIGISLRKSKTLIGNYFFLFFVLFTLHSQTNVLSISEEVLFWLTAGISAKSFR